MPTPTGLPSFAPCAWESVTVKLVAPPFAARGYTVTEAKFVIGVVCVFGFTANVIVPDVARYDLPARAETSCVWYETVTAEEDGFDKVTGNEIDGSPFAVATTDADPIETVSVEPAAPSDAVCEPEAAGSASVSTADAVASTKNRPRDQPPLLIPRNPSTPSVPTRSRPLPLGCGASSA